MTTYFSEKNRFVSEAGQGQMIPARDTSLGLDRRSLLKALTGAAATLGGLFVETGSASAQAEDRDIHAYKVDWSAERLDALRTRIGSYKFPRLIPDSKWKYGCDPEYLRALCDYWVNGFDANAAMRNLNRYPQFITRVEDIDIQFIRVIGEGGDRRVKRPLLNTHGWPGSTFEFWQVIEPLAFPSRHGGKPEEAFDLIIPSLPGYGPSGKPKAPIGARTTARLFNKLMRENLGYDSYYAQGGDWGAGVTGWLALDYPEVVKAIHLNLMIVAPQVPAETPAEEKFYREAAADEQRWGAYYQLQATEPQSLAYGMIDNPVGQAAWLIQRFYEWSDKRTRSFDQVFSMDELLTNVMIYIMNDSFQTSTWFYTGCYEEAVTRMPKGKRVTVPTGFAAYSGDSRSPNPPRSLVEKGYNLKYWAEIPQGGHFASMEVPELYVQDLRNWASALDLK
jgi:pimeloyl-ACP methyl ester carboxylesterase